MGRVLLGVTGGVAAYKALELVRLATKAGHAVRVVQTPASLEFVGKATFGFVSKYLKGANVPSGNTAFQFTAGSLNFKSTGYEWLQKARKSLMSVANRRAPAHSPSEEAPVAHAAARDVARAEDEVGLLGRRREPEYVRGVVGEVAVHLEHELGAQPERVAEACEVGRAEPFLTRPVEDVDVVVPGGKPVGDLAGPVRRVVVDDQDVQVLERKTAERPNHRLEVLVLVVGRQADDCSHAAHIIVTDGEDAPGER